MSRILTYICVYMSVAVMLSLTVSSCTSVDLNRDNPTDDSIVTFNVEWPSGLAQEDIPDDVLVLMSRTQNEALHYLWYLDKYGQIASDQIQTFSDEADGAEEDSSEDSSELPSEGEDSDDVQDDETPSEGEDEKTGVRIMNGYYAVAALAVNDHEDCIVTNLDGFETAEESAMGTINVEVPVDDALVEDFLDINPMYPYIRNVGPIYYVKPGAGTHTLISHSVKKNVIRLGFLPLTRKITFSIKLDVEPGVSVGSVYGIIAGVPRSVQMMSGKAKQDNLGKVAFMMSPKGGSMYEGSANVLGLFHQDEADTKVGPGVFNVFVNASAGDKECVLYSSINLRDAIRAANVMLQDTKDRSEWYFSDLEYADNNNFKAKDYWVNVPVAVPIKKADVLKGMEGGYEIWTPNVDTGDDGGMNPEL